MSRVFDAAEGETPRRNSLMECADMSSRQTQYPGKLLGDPLRQGLRCMPLIVRMYMGITDRPGHRLLVKPPRRCKVDPQARRERCD